MTETKRKNPVDVLITSSHGGGFYGKVTAIISEYEVTRRTPTYKTLEEAYQATKEMIIEVTVFRTSIEDGKKKL